MTNPMSDKVEAAPIPAEDRYDIKVLRMYNHDLDVVCPKCNSAIGFPCTVPVRDGQSQRSEVHEERKKAKNGSGE